MSATDFIQIIAPSDTPSADEAFRLWAEERRSAGLEWADDEVRIDTIRASDGRTLRRYLVSRRLVDEP